MAPPMPWTAAMQEYLSDREWHAVEEVERIGMAAIPDDRAEQEMNQRASFSTPENRIIAGKRTIVKQVLTSFRRFNKAKFSEDKKKIRWISDKSLSSGALVERVDELEKRVAELEQLVSHITSTESL